MSDEDFQTQVLGHLSAFGQRFDAMDARLDGMDRRFDRIDGQLRAIVLRLDDQDREMDQLNDKIDRIGTRIDSLTVSMNVALKAAEEAVRGNTVNGRRITKLEGDAGET